MVTKEKIDIPFIVWEITSKCQMKCIHCYNSEENASDLANDQLVKIAEQLNQEGLSILISGGEPLLSSSFTNLQEFTTTPYLLCYKFIGTLM